MKKYSGLTNRGFWPEALQDKTKYYTRPKVVFGFFWRPHLNPLLEKKKVIVNPRTWRYHLKARRKIRWKINSVMPSVALLAKWSRTMALCWFEWVDTAEKNPNFKSRIMCLRLKSFDWISDKRSFQSVPIKVPYFSLAQRKVPPLRGINLWYFYCLKTKENRPFCTPVPKKALLDSCSRICPPNHSPLPFRRWRNNAHPLAEAVEVQLALAAKRPKKNDSLFAAFEKSPTWKMTGRSWPIRLRRRVQFLQWTRKAFSGDFSWAEVFCATFFWKKWQR